MWIISTHQEALLVVVVDNNQTHPPKDGVLAWPKAGVLELAPPNKLLEVLAPNNPAPVLAPKPPACKIIGLLCGCARLTLLLLLNTVAETLPGLAPKAGVAEPPKPKLDPEDVLAPKLKPELYSKQKPTLDVTSSSAYSK